MMPIFRLIGASLLLSAAIPQEAHTSTNPVVEPRADRPNLELRMRKEKDSIKVWLHNRSAAKVYYHLKLSERPILVFDRLKASVNSELDFAQRCATGEGEEPIAVEEIGPGEDRPFSPITISKAPAPDATRQVAWGQERFLLKKGTYAVHIFASVWEFPGPARAKVVKERELDPGKGLTLSAQVEGLSL